jgi:hypothetical protein
VLIGFQKMKNAIFSKICVLMLQTVFENFGDTSQSLVRECDTPKTDFHSFPGPNVKHIFKRGL